MKTILIAIILAMPMSLSAQFFGFGLSYIYEDHIGNYWHDAHGISLAFGCEGGIMEDLSLSYAFRYNFQFSQPKHRTILDSIHFEVPDEFDPWGYGTVKYNKFGVSLEGDIGYLETEYDAFEPFGTLGFHFNSFDTKLWYDLYNTPDTCACFNTEPKQFTNTLNLGYKIGGGFRIRPTETFFLDFRATYNGGWILGKKGDPGLPDFADFSINADGDAQVPFVNRSYLNSWTFKVGIIVRLDLSNVEWGGYDSDDSDDSDRDSNSSGSRPSSSGGCETQELKPSRSGRGG